MRRSWEPGIRYPRKRPESNHLLTVRGATLQIFATWPVVNTFFMSRTPLAIVWCETSEVSSPLRFDPCPGGDPPEPTTTALPGWGGRAAAGGRREDTPTP